MSRGVCGHARRKQDCGQENVLVVLGIQMFGKRFLGIQIARGLGRFQRNDEPFVRPMHSPNTSIVYVQGYISQTSQTLANQGPDDVLRNGGGDRLMGLVKYLWCKKVVVVVHGVNFSSVTESAAHVLEADSLAIGGVVLLKCIGGMMQVIFCRA